MLETSYDPKGRLREYQKERFELAGDTAEGVGWKSKELQQLLFGVIESMGIRQNSSVLDVGCGLGHFYDYLNKKGYCGKYTGVDLSTVVLDQARARLPGVDFRSGDFWKDRPVEGAYDFVVASGIFCTRFATPVPAYERYVKDMIEKMFHSSREGLIFNMLSCHVDYESPELYYADPAAYFNFVRSLTSFITIKQDVASYFFTIAAYKQARNYGLPDGA